MKQSEIHTLYLTDMINSMEQDLSNWTMESHGAAGWSWLEFRSPTYKTQSGGTKSFGISLNYTGCWIDGRIAWTVPFLVRVNPFSSSFWRYHTARLKMQRHLKKAADLKHLEYLANNK